MLSGIAINKAKHGISQLGHFPYQLNAPNGLHHKSGDLHAEAAGGNNSYQNEKKTWHIQNLLTSMRLWGRAQYAEVPLPTTTVSACIVLNAYPACAFASADNPGGLG